MSLLLEKDKFPDPIWLKSMEYRHCLICKVEGCVGHHIFRMRWDDRMAVPLCGKHHAGWPESVHPGTNEVEWWFSQAPEIIEAALVLWAREKTDSPSHNPKVDKFWALKMAPDILKAALKLWAIQHYERKKEA